MKTKNTDRLWAPWRHKLFLKPLKGCIFCSFPRSRADRRNYLVRRSPKTFVLLNLYPYNNGHLLLAPYRHIPLLEDLTPQESAELMGEAQLAISILDKVLKPEGYNLGMNLGKAGGAAFAGHLHLHIVPRWKGDTNFMPVTQAPKVVSRSLGALHAALKKAYARA